MARTPFDLSFKDLAEAGAKASKAAREEAARGGVPVATLETAASPSEANGSRKRGAAANRQIGLRRRIGG